MKSDLLKSNPVALSSVESRKIVKDHLLASASLKQRIAHENLDAIVIAARHMATSLQRGGKVLLCGNGGSAADCQHIAGELVNWLSKDFPRSALPAIALTADNSILTAIANDSSFDCIFERQVEALGKPEDVLLGISTSGNSTNVVKAVQAARSLQMTTIVLTGRGGCLGEFADVVIQVPDDNTQWIQEAHLAIEHILCDLIEMYLFNKG